MQRPFRVRVGMIVWPAFLMAGVLEMAVFGLVDPLALGLLGAEGIGASRMAIYSASFLVFWGAIATSGAITKLLEDGG